MFLRALRIVSPEYMDEEFYTIRQIGIKNNFNRHEIEECLILAKQSFYQVERKKDIDMNKVLFLPFHPSFNDIVYPLRLLNFHVIFSYNNTIGRSIIRNTPKEENGVIYRIPCECGKFNVGQTGKDVKTRIAQHKYSIRANAQNNAINLHIQRCHSPILWHNTEILFKENDLILRNILETACISFSRSRNFNNSSGLFKLDPLFLHIVAQQYKFKMKNFKQDS